DDRSLDRDLLGVGALLAGLQDPEDRVASRKIFNAFASGTDDAGEIPPKAQGKLGLLVLAKAHFPIGGVDAGGMDVNERLARPRNRVRQVAISQDFRAAKLFNENGLHHRTVSRRFDVNKVRALSALTGSPNA